MLQIFMLIIFGLSILPNPVQETQIQSNTEELNLTLIMDRISKTSPEGLAVIDRAKRMVPEIQSHLSAKTLGEAVEDCISGQSEFAISTIGWEAYETPTSDWTIVLYFKDQDQKYLKAIWTFNKDRSVLIPSEFTNATKFWVRRSDHKRP